MSSSREQICNCPYVKHSRKHMKYMKRATAKYLRREAKKLLDDAPKKLAMKGYSD